MFPVPAQRPVTGSSKGLTATYTLYCTGTPMLAGKLPDSPPRGAGYTSPLRASQQSIGVYKAAGMWQPDSRPHLVQQENTACAGILAGCPSCSHHVYYAM